MNFKDRSIATRFLLDTLVLSVAFLLALGLAHDHLLYEFRKRDILHFAILLYGWYHFADRFDYYRNFRLKNITQDFLATLRMSLIMSTIYVIVAFLLDTGGNERLGFIRFSIAFAPILFLRKYLYRRLYRVLSPNNKDGVLFVGISSVGQEILESIRLRPWMGYSSCGAIQVNSETDSGALLSELNLKIEQYSPSRVFIEEANLSKELLDEVVSACLEHTVQPFVIPDGLKFFSERYQVQYFDDIPIIAVRKNPLERFRYVTIKRIFDLAFSGFLLLTVLPPVFLIIAILIKLNSKGPVFFVQKRWGMNNVPFSTLKFRSMTTESSDVVEGKYQQAQQGDARITKIGAFLRKSNLDELPQFINVLLGDMSVVGPRPHPGPLNEESKEVVTNYLQRHLVKPGITGWAQVNGARGETKKVSQMQKRVDYDIWYIENWSFALDIRIVLQTVWNMYKGDDHAF